MSDLLHQKIVVTRKAHNCFGCGRSFPAGTLMRSETAKDLQLFRYYLCCTCQDLVDGMDPQDEYGYGDLREDALEAEKGGKGNTQAAIMDALKAKIKKAKGERGR